MFVFVILGTNIDIIDSLVDRNHWLECFYTALYVAAAAILFFYAKMYQKREADAI